MIKPNTLPASSQKISQNEAYIFDNNEYIYLFLGSQVSDDFIYNVFGYTNVNDMKFNGVTTFTPVEGSEPSQTLSAFIE